MVSKTSSKNRSLGITAIVAAIVIIVAAIGYLAFAYNSSQSSSGDNQSIVPTGDLVTIKGTILCLPHKDTTGPQTMECAYGLKDEAGTYYALGDSDPGFKNISGVAMNEQVEVTGNLKKQASTIYPTVGTITVTKISKVQ